MTSAPAATPVVVLISGAGTTMAAILDATRDPEYGVCVAAVVSDRPDARGLQIARDAAIPTAVVALGDFPTRDKWNEALVTTIGAFSPDLVFCAGFMKILGAPMLDTYGGRIINTHPALLPAYPGPHGVRDALAGGAKVTGCTVMLVDEGIDTGPILAQAVVEVRDNDDEAALHERIKEVERVLVVDTLGRMARDGWTVDGRTVRVGVRGTDEG